MQAIFYDCILSTRFPLVNIRIACQLTDSNAFCWVPTHAYNIDSWGADWAADRRDAQ